MLLALALAGLVAMTIGAAQVPAAVDVPVPADVPANVPVPADAPAGGEVPTAGTDYDWPVAGDPPEVLRPFDPPPRPWLPGHRGVDLSARDGAEVRAAGPGTVAFAGHVAGRPVVSIQHPGGLRTTYEPVTGQVQVGDAVETGTLIGHLASAGAHCPRACLHWGLRTGDERYLDPLLLVGREVTIRLYPAAGSGQG